MKEWIRSPPSPAEGQNLKPHLENTITQKREWKAGFTICGAQTASPSSRFTITRAQKIELLPTFKTVYSWRCQFRGPESLSSFPS